MAQQNSHNLDSFLEQLESEDLRQILVLKALGAQATAVSKAMFHHVLRSGVHLTLDVGAISQDKLVDFWRPSLLQAQQLTLELVDRKKGLARAYKAKLVHLFPVDAPLLFNGVARLILRVSGIGMHNATK